MNNLLKINIKFKGNIMKKFNLQDYKKVINDVDQAIANAEIESIQYKPGEREMLIEVVSKERQGLLTEDEVDQILIEHVLEKYK